ncbi:hypothetical protein WN943_002878 [Citrus x changshan-huyou]
MPSSARSMPPFLPIAFGYAGSKEICLSLPRENVNLGIHDEWRKIKTHINLFIFVNQNGPEKLKGGYDDDSILQS